MIPTLSCGPRCVVRLEISESSTLLHFQFSQSPLTRGGFPIRPVLSLIALLVQSNNYFVSKTAWRLDGHTRKRKPFPHKRPRGHLFGAVFRPPHPLLKGCVRGSLFGPRPLPTPGSLSGRARIARIVPASTRLIHREGGGSRVGGAGGPAAKPADIWALGVTLLQLVTGRLLPGRSFPFVARQGTKSPKKVHDFAIAKCGPGGKTNQNHATKTLPGLLLILQGTHHRGTHLTRPLCCPPSDLDRGHQRDGGNVRPRHHAPGLSKGHPLSAGWRTIQQSLYLFAVKIYLAIFEFRWSSYFFPSSFSVFEISEVFSFFFAFLPTIHPWDWQRDSPPPRLRP